MKTKIYSGSCLFFFRVEADSDEEVYEKIETAINEHNIQYINIDEVEEEEHYEDNYGN